MTEPLFASAGSSGVSPTFYIVFGVILALTFTVMRVIANRRNRQRTEGVLNDKGASLDGAPELLTFTVAPARPLPEAVAALRAALRDTTSEVRITRYTRPVVIVDRHVLSLNDKSAGTFLSIPATDIVSISASKVRLHPQGSLPMTRPAITVRVSRAGVTYDIVLAPITGMYDFVSLPQAQRLAEAMQSQLGLGSQRLDDAR